MIDPKRIRFVLICLLTLELISGIEWGIHRGLSSLYAKQVLSISSYIQIGYIVSVFGLSKAITNLLFGAISDRIGRKPVILLGIILTGLGGALIGSATEYASVLIGTAFIGVGGGATFVGIMVSMIETLPLQIGLGMGLFELAAYGGSSIGTYFGGGFSLNYGLRYPFYFFGVLSIIGAALILLLLPETNTDKQRGTALYITPKRVVRDFIKIAPLCIGGFSSKILDSLVISFLPLFLVGSQLSLDRVAIVLSSYTLSWALLQPVTGHLSDRIGRKAITLIGLAFSSITMVAFTLTVDYIFLVLLALLLGVEAALFYTPLVAMVSDIAPSEVEGTLIGSYRFFRDIGYFFGPIILGEIADFYRLNYSIYVASAIIVSATFILGLFLEETNPKNI